MTRRAHHRRETALINGHSACFAQCGRAAGHHPPRFTASAYCEFDQVYDSHPVPSGACACPRCLRLFGSVTLFDLHLAVDYAAPDPVTCLPPDELPGEPLVLVNAVWLTERGAASRRVFAERNAAARADAGADR